MCIILCKTISHVKCLCKSEVRKTFCEELGWKKQTCQDGSKRIVLGIMILQTSGQTLFRRALVFMLEGLKYTMPVNRKLLNHSM